MARHDEIARAIPLLNLQLRQARAREDQRATREVLFSLALCYDQLGSYQETLTSFQELLPLVRAAQDQEKEQTALIGSASAMTHLQRYVDSLPTWRAALELTRTLADQQAETEVLSNFGFALMQAQLPAQALPLLEEALILLHASDNRRSEANTLNTLGVVLSQLGRVDEAMARYEQALTIARALGDKQEQAFLLGNLGNEHVDHLGQPERAVQYFKEALSLFRELGDREQEAQTLYNLGKTYQRASQLERAERALKQGRWLAGDLRDADLRIRILELLSDVMAQQGRIDDAVEFTRQGRGTEEPYDALKRHQEAREHARARGDTRAEVFHLGEVATALGVLNHRAEALSANLAAIVLYRQLGDRHGEGICFVNIGTLCYFLSRFPECLACWLRSLEVLHGEESADEELLQRKLESVEQQWGKRTFKRYRDTSMPFLLQIGTPNNDLQALFAPILTLAQEQDLEERIDGEEYPALAALLGAERTTLSHGEVAEIRSLLPGIFIEADAETWGPDGEEDLEDVEECARLILEGRRALLKKHYLEARDLFAQALEYDPEGCTSARLWYALTCLWVGEVGLEEATELFEEVADEGDIAGEGTLARILARWCDLCRYPTRQAYLDWLRELYDCESEAEALETLEPYEGDIVRGGAEGALFAGLLYLVQGETTACLRMLADIDVTGHPFSPWIRSFWQAMAQATGGEEDPARGQVRAALAQGMPPLLLGPLRWLKPADPDPSSWYERIALPLLAAHGHLYGAYLTPASSDGASTLPSQAAKRAAIRPGLLLMAAEGEGETEHQLQLVLSGARGPGGPGQLVFVEFDQDVATGTQPVLWPTRFAVCYPHAPGGIARCFQEFWIDYTAGSMQVQLIDRGFRPMSGANAIPTAGRDFQAEHGPYFGRGGIFWAGRESDLPVVNYGATTRLDHLPSETLAYLQTLVDEALPYLEVYCEVCGGQMAQVCGVWCEHNWFCLRCQHISSPIERSRRMVGESPRYCSHRFPKHVQTQVGSPQIH